MVARRFVGSGLSAVIFCPAFPFLVCVLAAIIWTRLCHFRQSTLKSGVETIMSRGWKTKSYERSDSRGGGGWQSEWLAAGRKAVGGFRRRNARNASIVEGSELAADETTTKLLHDSRHFVAFPRRLIKPDFLWRSGFPRFHKLHKKDVRAQPSKVSWNALTFSTVSWLNPLLALGAKKALTEEDLPELNSKEQATYSIHWLDEYSAQSRNPSISSNKLTLFNALLPFVLPIICSPRPYPFASLS
ncbi:hypothetical protein BC830DRAFT_594191 [Chytriomyces sp. MP71]|nr:hypothetical protein BC830DRAFT_594191 [Chytriomyces sp. MP71]